MHFAVSSSLPALSALLWAGNRIRYTRGMPNVPRDASSSHTAVLRALLSLSALNIAVSLLLFLTRPHANGLSALLLSLRGKIGEDSSYFMDLAFSLARSTEPLYPTLVLVQHKKFQYPTSSLLIGYVAQALHTSMHTVIAVIVMVSALLTLWFAGSIFLLLLPGQGSYRWQVRALVASLGIFFYPLINGLNLGQIQTLITFLFTLALWLWMRHRRASAGIALAIACAFKPPLALFLLWGVLRRQWRFVVALLGMAALLQLLAVLAFGWRHEFEYLAALRFLSHHGESIPENQSVNGWLQRLLRNGFSDPSPGYFWYPPYNAVVYFGTLLSTVALLTFALVVPMWRRWRDPVADFVLFGLVSTIASPIVWTHHYGVFYAGCVYVVAVSLRQTGRISAAFVVCFVLLANYAVVLGSCAANPFVNWIYSYPLYAGLVLIGLLCFQLRHNSAEARHPAKLAPV